MVLNPHPLRAVIGRAPGRVNLIGEHVDYNGFAVLPMAIDRRTEVRATPLAAPVLRVCNADPGRFPAEEIPLAALATRPPRRTWVDYVVAAARCRPPVRGVELLVSSTVPVAAGLSSSSALVVATFLALGEAGDRLALAEEARLAERYVGTLSGGMDQAIALLGRPGHCVRIEFRPLRARPIAMPEELVVVVLDSGVPAPKGGAAQDGYNARVRECLAAAQALGAPAGGLLADVPGADRRARAGVLADPLLRRRASFVFDEAARVDEAEAALRRGDLAALGALLDRSHAGLRDLYDVSCPELDALVARAKAAGALGARLVGAGFGGCAIALTTRQAADGFLARLGGPALVCVAAGGAERVPV
ncbi:MAG: galactokinase [Planctomycetes bacterium]|nr:galactokinase [Planctomycetota bacterium]